MALCQAFKPEWHATCFYIIVNDWFRGALYGFPIERALFYYIPALQEWWQLFLVALPVTLLFAILSWHLIEKPCLNLKHKLKDIDIKMPWASFPFRPPAHRQSADTPDNPPAQNPADGF